MNEKSKIFIVGHNGLASSALRDKFLSKGYTNLIGHTHSDNELLDALFVKSFFDTEKPEYVILIAANESDVVAGNILFADFLYKNLQIQNNVIWESYRHKVKKLLFVADSFIYPPSALLPVSEDSLLSSPLDNSSEPYAIAMIAGLKMCESFNIQYGTSFLAVTPTETYGPNDHFQLGMSHFLPVLIRKIYLAKCLKENNWSGIMSDLKRRSVDGIMGKSPVDEAVSTLNKYGIYSSYLELNIPGNTLGDFIWSEDMADACFYILKEIDFNTLLEGKDEIRNCHINIGTGQSYSVRELAAMVAGIIKYDGRIKFKTKASNNLTRSLIDVTKLNSFGWTHKVELEDGVGRLYRWYLEDLNLNR